MKKETHMKGMVFKGNDKPITNMNKHLASMKAGSSPFQHGEKDPGEHKDIAAHKAWHDENGFTKDGKTGPTPRESDFSEHNIATRKTEGTIAEQAARRKANKAKKPK